MSFTITALPTEVAQRHASAGFVDAYGNELHAELQTAGGNPCRHCLRRARAGETLVLFSYSPFDRRNPYKEVGPIFVHAGGCERYAANDLVPGDFLATPIALRGYDLEQRIVEVDATAGEDAAARIEALFAKAEVAFVHARSLTHGCYLFRADRAAGASVRRCFSDAAKVASAAH